MDKKDEQRESERERETYSRNDTVADDCSVDIRDVEIK